MKWKIGEQKEKRKKISEKDIDMFAELSEDFNGLHMDEYIAKNSIFGSRIAHGFLVGSLISSVIGMQLPGEGTIYVKQNMEFLKPVYVNDTVTARVEIIEILNEQKGILKLRTYVINQKGEMVIEGEAIVKAPV